MPNRNARATTTREKILAAAERLFAEHGLFAVSNRQIGEAAGQGNNTAVGYHFGTKTDLVRAIIRKHTEPIEEVRRRMLAEVEDTADVREWVACLVRPVTDHLATLGSPTWYARFGAQVLADPVFREIMLSESLGSPTLLRVIDGFNQCLPRLPAEVRMERHDMARQLIVHMCAERERALADGAPVARPSWRGAAAGLIDAIAAVWLAPVSR